MHQGFRMKRIALILLLLSVSGHALAQEPEKSNEPAFVVFYRDSRLSGGGVDIPCVVDGKIVALLPNGSYTAKIPVQAGRRSVAVHARPKSEFPIYEEDTIAVDLDVGEVQYIKVIFNFQDMSTTSRFMPKAVLVQQEAEQAIAFRKLKPVSPKSQ